MKLKKPNDIFKSNLNVSVDNFLANVNNDLKLKERSKRKNKTFIAYKKHRTVYDRLDE